ncbi:dihydrolipoamide dehydrogenase [Desulfosporosinus orientis DSM 765]|uniref:Dihydrolipoyl dehydrogenase n=1 Tax=Desulfosporosinus orientis (strain ATCC 19365 / DSM 765 / NCIMB 8382 / VKM B-1628 / Singapore I) TaxID=768706 RepID=G7WHE0_DESOD|nr:dihydrolipoyl dehydrogenase [Desulfosporosinus orientis]AET70230.1 dihydrolipoamide dehydrogenase [Desulfosporosinus orientis DSM 765]
MDYQVGILGGGPGGYVCALRAAQLGLSVLLVEGEKLGGTCLNRGCIPTKALVKSADLWREMGRAEEFGLFAGEKRIDYSAVVARKDQVVNSLVNGVDKLMKAAKIHVVKGWGEFNKVGQLSVATEGGEENYSVENIILATGSVPARIPIPGSDLPGVVTSDEILEGTQLPKHLVIIGGGVIGLEFASIYEAFGVKVSVVEMLPTLLPTIDEEIPKRLTPLLKRSRIDVYTKTAVKGIRKDGENLVVEIEDSKGLKEIQADRVLLSTGRRPNLRGIDVNSLGLETERGAIKVNAQMQTNLPNVYAIGDVVGGIMLAHVASEEGIVAVEHIAGRSVEMNYKAIPSAIFTHPEIATVGLTEQELKASGQEYHVSKFPFSANGKALALGESVGLVKILADSEGIVKGASIMGPQASTLISELVIAVEKGLRAEDIARTVHAHPTLPEAVMEAAHGIMGKPLHLA